MAEEGSAVSPSESSQSEPGEESNAAKVSEEAMANESSADAAAKKETAKTPDANWQCQLDAKGNDDGKLTVGDMMFLSCEGEPVELNREKLQLKFSDDRDKHALKILEIKDLSETSANLVVTSYLIGRHEISGVRLSDGEKTAELNTLNWDVDSVVRKQQQKMAEIIKGDGSESKKAEQIQQVLQGRKKTTEPFGPFGPVKMALPMWYWFILAAVLLVLTILGYLKFRKHLVRKKLIEKITGSRVDPDDPDGSTLYHSALAPFHQYSKKIRSLNREHHFAGSDAAKVKEFKGDEVEHYIGELDKTFRLYIARQLIVPALDWKSPAVLADIKKRHRHLYKRMGKDLRVVFRELDRAELNRKKITSVDCLQIAHLCGRIAEEVWKESRQRK